jgi:hypothetical protein
LSILSVERLRKPRNVSVRMTRLPGENLIGDLCKKSRQTNYSTTLDVFEINPTFENSHILWYRMMKKTRAIYVFAL